MKTLWRCMAMAAAACAFEGASAVQTQILLSSVKGQVLVSTGIGFVPAMADQGLKPGDRVMVSEGTATLHYGPDCSVPLAPNSMTTVADAGCALSTHDTGPDPASNNAAAPTNAAQLILPALVVIPAITIGIITIVDELDDEDDDEEPVSP